MVSVKRLGKLAVAAVLLPLVLSGCLRTNADVQIGNDGDIGTAVVQVGINKSLAKQAGVFNLAGFETYVKTNKKVVPGDECVFSESQSEYLMDCHTADVVDNEGQFTGITASTSGGKLYVTARDGALTEDLAEYDPHGLSVGSIMFYFDGEIESISAPNSKYRIPSSGVVAFDLDSGKFFNDNAIIVVTPHRSLGALYAGIAIGLLFLAGIIYVFTRSPKPRNPFVDSKEMPSTKPADSDSQV